MKSFLATITGQPSCRIENDFLFGVCEERVVNRAGFCPDYCGKTNSASRQSGLNLSVAAWGTGNLKVQRYVPVDETPVFRLWSMMVGHK